MAGEGPESKYPGFLWSGLEDVCGLAGGDAEVNSTGTAERSSGLLVIPDGRRAEITFDRETTLLPEESVSLPAS